MMKYFKISQFLKITFAGASGLACGVYLEKNILVQSRAHSFDAPTAISHYISLNGGCLNEKLRRHIPGLPVFSTVSARTQDYQMIGGEVIPYNSSDRKLSISKSKDALVPAAPSSASSRTAQIMRFGFPGLDNIRSFSDFVLSYDRRNRTAHWVFEHLTKESVQRNDAVDRQKSDFREDESVHTYFRSTNADYRYSGYDRGHLAAAGNHRTSQTACDDTFHLSNMAPQVGKGFNRDKWEHLERYVRKLTRNYPNVYVCTGPLYLPHPEPDGKMYVKYEVIGNNFVSVPTHFFKVIVCEAENGDLEMESYVLPNRQIPDETVLQSFRVPPEAVERGAGLLFFDRVSRQKLKKINGAVP